MSRHAQPKQAALRLRVFATPEEFALLDAMELYRTSGDPDLLGPITRQFASLLPPYGNDRKREPGKHARRGDA